MIANRIVSLDVAKAICIILVVIGHYVPDNSPEWYVAIHDVIYTFHMPLFMFASGFVYIATKKNESYGTFILKKVKRLMVPYISTSVLVITIKLLTQGNMTVDNPVTIMSYVKMLYSPEAGYFLWFIWALWWMFVVVSLMKTAKSRLILFFLAVIVHFVPLKLPEVFCIPQFKNMLVYFMLGVVCFENKTLHSFIKNFHSGKVVVSVLLFIVFEYITLANTGMTSIKNITSIMLPYIGILFVLEISKLICKYKSLDKGSILILISSSSYIIYLFHTTFEGFAKAVCRKLPLDSNLTYIFVPEVIVVVGCGVVIPIILYKYVFVRYEITRVLFGLGKARNK